MERRERYFHECPECGLLTPWLQRKCDCGYRFAKKAPAFFRKSDSEEVARLEEMLSRTVSENDAEWSRFFDKAKLKNTITGGPIRSREDFYKWAEQFDAAKKKRERQKQAEEAAKRKTEKEAEKRKEIQDLVRDPHVHYIFITKWEAAIEAILDFSFKIQDRVKASLAANMYDASFYIIAGALCTWAELTLDQKREWSEEFISNISDDYSDNPGPLKKAMLSAADTVGFALEGSAGKDAMLRFSAMLMKLLLMDKDAAICSDISALLVSFSVSYVSSLEHSV